MITDELAQRFNLSLPADFKAYRDKGGGDLPPWCFADDAFAINLKSLVDEKYKTHRACLPFAYDLSTDDIAMFTPEGKVRPLHLYASEGWESFMEYPSFRAWLPGALALCIHQLECIATGKWYEPNTTA
jgi:hypothetical protein